VTENKTNKFTKRYLEYMNIFAVSSFWLVLIIKEVGMLY